MMVLRKKLKTTAYKAVLWITILAVAGVFSLVEIFRSIGKHEDWVIQVDKEIVRQKELMRAVAGQQEHINLFRAYYGQQADLFAQLMGMPLNPVALAIEKVIKEMLLQQAQLGKSIKLHDHYISDKATNVEFLFQMIPEMVSGQVFDAQGVLMMPRLERHLRAIGLRIADFEKAVTQAAHAEFILQLVGTFGYATQSEIKHRLIQQYAGKQFDLIKIPFEPLVKAAEQAGVTDTELQAFYAQKNAQMEAYWVPEKRAGTVWIFPYTNYGITIDEPAITAYYAMHRDTQFLKTPAQVQVRRLAFESYEAADKARIEYAQNPTIFIEKAELIPFFARTGKEPEFERAAFLIQKEGEFSTVIKTKKGFEIIQLVARKAQEFQTKEEARTAIIDHLSQERFSHTFNNDVQAILARLKETNNDQEWKQFVQSKKAIRQEVPLVSQNDVSDDQHILFSLANIGDYGSQLQAGKGYVGLLEQKNLRFLPTLESIKAQVKKDFYTEQATRNMQLMLEQARKDICEHHDIATVASSVNSTVYISPFLKKDDAESNKWLRQFNLSLNDLYLEQIGATQTVMRQQASYVIVLKAIESLEEDFIQKYWASIEQEVIHEQSALLQRAFLASLYRPATIELNELLLAELAQRMSI